MSGDSAAQTADFLRQTDRDRYFATLLLPEAERAGVQALLAFSADVASVRERVRDPAAGEIRLTWWTDALAGHGHGEVHQNPLADALLRTIETYRLPAAPFSQLIEARRFDLYHDPMPDLPSFEGYAGETVSIVHQLAAMILNGGEDVRPGDAAGHLGVAQALIGHLRAFGYNAARQQLFLPWSVFAANGVQQEEIFAGTSSEGLMAALGQLQEMAEEHLQKAEAAIGAVPRAVRLAFAPVVLQRVYLKALPTQSGGAFSAPRPISDWRKLAALTLWGWRQR